jgi:trk system potassium uptake protein TrkA
MNIIVVGCGRVGAELAYRLFRSGHHVTVIDSMASAFETLPADFRGRTLEGDVLAQDVLRRAGAEHADALASVTPSDAVNAVVARTAHEFFHVRQVVIRNYDPKQRPLLEAFGLPIVAPSTWGAQRIEEQLSDASMPALFSSGNGEVEVYECIVPSAWAGKTLGELLPAGQCLPVAVARAGRAMLPGPDTPLKAGDVVHVSATEDGIRRLRQQLDVLEEA